MPWQVVHQHLCIGNTGSVAWISGGCLFGGFWIMVTQSHSDLWGLRGRLSSISICSVCNCVSKAQPWPESHSVRGKAQVPQIFKIMMGKFHHRLINRSHLFNYSQGMFCYEVNLALFVPCSLSPALSASIRLYLALHSRVSKTFTAESCLKVFP